MEWKAADWLLYPVWPEAESSYHWQKFNYSLETEGRFYEFTSFVERDSEEKYFPER